jgi:hypothetical protein
MRPTQLLAPICLFAAASTAWKPLEVLKHEVAPLLRRQDGGSSSTTSKFNLSFSGTQGNTATTDTSSATATSGSDASSESGTQTGSRTGSATGKTTGKASSGSGSAKSTYQTTKTFDARLPAGGVQMITPAAIAQASYYKIKDYVTFAWNYTSLSVTPSAVDILASCSLNQATYTLAMNQSITGATGAITWDTNQFQQTASTTLLTGTYTLIIHDAAKDVSSTPQAGYLGTFDQFTFGMYQPQSYTPMADWVCATCNAAMSSVERQTMGFLFGMVVLTVLSFGWFAGVAGVF